VLKSSGHYELAAILKRMQSRFGPFGIDPDIDFDE
jgi:hypothetical protein